MIRKSQISVVAAALALAAGCSVDDSSAATPGGGPGSGGGAPSDDDFVLPGPPDGGGVGGGSSCGASRYVAEEIIADVMVEVPVEVSEEVTVEVTEEITEEITEVVTTVKPAALYIMFDRSASMDGLTGNGDLWTPAVGALKAVVSDADSAGLGVGLQYFPLASGGACATGAGYDTPAVAVGALPAHAAMIGASLDAQRPSGIGTPIEGALRGATEYCKRYQADHADEQCVAVLVTDGEPEYALGCSESESALAAIAKAAHDAGVTTFAVGLEGANFSLLDKIAQQGGAPDCDASSARYACDVSAGAEKLSDALASIREQVETTETREVTRTVVRPETRTETHIETHTEFKTEVRKSPVPCEWAIPEGNGGDELDRDKVNIRWSTDDASTTLVRVDSPQACRADAWHFDDPAQPTRLIACEQACAQITERTDSMIDILLGCATVLPD